MSCVSAAAGLLSSSYLYSDKGQRGILLLTLAVFATVYFLFYASGQLFWARIVPSSAADHLHQPGGRLCRTGGRLGLAIAEHANLAPRGDWRVVSA